MPSGAKKLLQFHRVIPSLCGFLVLQHLHPQALEAKFQLLKPGSYVILMLLGSNPCAFSYII